MSYNEYLRDKKRALPQIISPTRINTAGLFTQMQRYRAAVPQDKPESDGTNVQHSSGSNALATIGNAAVCCAPAQATVVTPCKESIKLQPYPTNGYRPPRCDPPAINYPPVDPAFCPCPQYIIPPSVPVHFHALPGENQITIFFSPGELIKPSYPYKNSADVDYMYSLNGDDYISGGLTSPIVVTGLSVDTTFVIRLQSVNSFGTRSGPTYPFTVYTRPGPPVAPTLTLAVAANGGAFIYFTNTDLFITTTLYTLDNGGTYYVMESTGRLAFIDNLGNGLQFTIHFVTANGDLLSAPSNPITVIPRSKPTVSAPTLYFDPSIPLSYSHAAGPIITSVGTGELTGSLDASIVITTDTAGCYSQIFRFNGTGGISFPTYDFGNSFTITAWIKPTQQVGLAGQLLSTGATGFTLGWKADKSLFITCTNDIPETNTLYSDPIITYNVWQQIGYAFNKETSMIIFFVNGKPISAVSVEMDILNVPTEKSFDVGSTMQADFGYLKMYNVCLNANDVNIEYNGTRARFGF